MNKTESTAVCSEFTDIKQLHLLETMPLVIYAQCQKNAVSSKINNIHKSEKHFLRSHFLSYLPFPLHLLLPPASVLFTSIFSHSLLPVEKQGKKGVQQGYSAGAFSLVQEQSRRAFQKKYPLG